MSDYFDPSIAEQNIVLILEPTLRKVEKLILGCDTCSSKEAQFHFEILLDLATGSHPTHTHYILEKPATCPQCRGDVWEKTPVEFDPGEWEKTYAG